MVVGSELQFYICLSLLKKTLKASFLSGLSHGKCSRISISK